MKFIFYSFVSIFFVGYLQTEGLSNGESNISAGVNNDKESVSGDLHALSRHQRDVDMTFACGIPPVPIDTRFYKCIDGVIVAFTISEHQDSCRDLLFCNGIVYCGAGQGYHCCGSERYNPEFQTCCQYTSAKYKVYDDMQEKSHICCNLDVYERSSTNARGEHPASNDKFFRNPRKKLGTNNRIFHESHYGDDISSDRYKDNIIIILSVVVGVVAVAVSAFVIHRIVRKKCNGGERLRRVTEDGGDDVSDDGELSVRGDSTDV